MCVCRGVSPDGGGGVGGDLQGGGEGDGGGQGGGRGGDRMTILSSSSG